MKTQNLNGNWSLRHESMAVDGESGAAIIAGRTQDWLQAKVPGEVHLDLMEAGLMEEPLFSNNAPQCRWVEDQSWWYRTSFDAKPDLIGADRIELVFDGLDYYAQVFLNGKEIGQSENAFVPAIFDITHTLQTTGNELIVRITAGTERANNQETGEASDEDIYGNRMSFKGRPELRKPQFTYGWDWVDALPNIGISREVAIRAYRKTRIEDVICTPEFSGEYMKCNLSLVVWLENVHPWKENPCRVVVEIISPAGKKLKNEICSLGQVGLSSVTFDLDIENPQLWWPNDMGAQPLYNVALQIYTGEEQCDSWSKEIGLRTVELDRSALSEGHRFCIRINGQDVFCKGGGWMPPDAIIARVTDEKIETLITEAKDAHFNMIRVNGCSIYEPDAFFRACDRAGILVWQDFMFTCSPSYPDHEEAFRHKVQEEAEITIRRLRHHPCIVLWCGSNENIQGFGQWWNGEKTFPGPDLELGGTHIYNRILPRVCASLDPDRPYWPSSPCGGDLPNSEGEGDCHWWGKATFNNDVSRRYRHEIYDECRSPFLSEYGIIGPCHMSSMREYLKPEELSLENRAMRCHTNSLAKDTTPAAITYHYVDSKGLSLEKYIRYGQMFQAVMHGGAIESMRFRKGDPKDDCRGAVFWGYTDCWGEIGWTPIDYYLRRKASYYWMRNAYYPIRAIIRVRNNELVTRIVNDRLEACEAVLRHGWMRVDGSDRELNTVDLKIEANSMAEIARENIPDETMRGHTEWIYSAWLEGKDIEASPSLWKLVPHRQLALPQSEIVVEAKGLDLTLTSKSYCHGVAYADEGARIFSDNYFDLLPSVPKIISCTAGTLPASLVFEAI